VAPISSLLLQANLKKMFLKNFPKTFVRRCRRRGRRRRVAVGVVVSFASVVEQVPSQPSWCQCY
jgi:hypothetical protein